MSEAAKRRPSGEFHRWTTKMRDDKLHALVEIIKKYPPEKAIHFTTDIPAFLERWTPHLMQPMASPFFMSCNGMVAAVAYDVLDQYGNELIEVIFDDNAIFKPRIQLWYPLIREAKENYDPTLRGVLPLEPTFQNDQDYVPLQAADMVAWLFRTAASGLRTDFEWIASELQPVIPMSEYASFFTADRMDDIVALSRRIPYQSHLIEKWKMSVGADYLRSIKLRKKGKGKPNC
jgi:hypothetical protein